MVVSITTPILKNNNVIGAMGIDLQVTDISKLMSTYKVGENGYTLLINKDGSIFIILMILKFLLLEGLIPLPILIRI